MDGIGVPVDGWACPGCSWTGALLSGSEPQKPQQGTVLPDNAPLSQRLLVLGRAVLRATAVARRRTTGSILHKFTEENRFRFVKLGNIYLFFSIVMSFIFNTIKPIC